MAIIALSIKNMIVIPKAIQNKLNPIRRFMYFTTFQVPIRQWQESILLSYRICNLFLIVSKSNNFFQEFSRNYFFFLTDRIYYPYVYVILQPMSYWVKIKL